MMVDENTDVTTSRAEVAKKKPEQENVKNDDTLNQNINSQNISDTEKGEKDEPTVKNDNKSPNKETEVNNNAEKDTKTKKTKNKTSATKPKNSSENEKSESDNTNSKENEKTEENDNTKKTTKKKGGGTAAPSPRIIELAEPNKRIIISNECYIMYFRPATQEKFRAKVNELKAEAADKNKADAEAETADKNKASQNHETSIKHEQSQKDTPKKGTHQKDKQQKVPPKKDTAAIDEHAKNEDSDEEMGETSQKDIEEAEPKEESSPTDANTKETKPQTRHERMIVLAQPNKRTIIANECYVPYFRPAAQERFIEKLRKYDEENKALEDSGKSEEKPLVRHPERINTLAEPTRNRVVANGRYMWYFIPRVQEHFLRKLIEYLSRPAEEFTDYLTHVKLSIF